jgi:hypothetical protein
MNDLHQLDKANRELEAIEYLICAVVVAAVLYLFS